MQWKFLRVAFPKNSWSNLLIKLNSILRPLSCNQIISKVDPYFQVSKQIQVALSKEKRNSWFSLRKNVTILNLTQENSHFRTVILCFLLISIIYLDSHSSMTLLNSKALKKLKVHWKCVKNRAGILLRKLIKVFQWQKQFWFTISFNFGMQTWIERTEQWRQFLFTRWSIMISCNLETTFLLRNWMSQNSSKYFHLNFRSSK